MGGEGEGEGEEEGVDVGRDGVDEESEGGSGLSSMDGVAAVSASIF